MYMCLFASRVGKSHAITRNMSRVLLNEAWTDRLRWFTCGLIHENACYSLILLGLCFIQHFLFIQIVKMFLFFYKRINQLICFLTLCWEISICLWSLIISTVILWWMTHAPTNRQDFNCYVLLHQAWLDHHSRSLGLFVDGKCVRSAERQCCTVTDSKG